MKVSTLGKMIAAAFVVPLVVLPLLYPSAFAATPVAGTAPSASHADYSKCKDPTLPSVSCRTTVTYDECEVRFYDNGVKVFACAFGAFPDGLSAYLDANRAQSVTVTMPLGDDYPTNDITSRPHAIVYLVVTQHL